MANRRERSEVNLCFKYFLFFFNFSFFLVGLAGMIAGAYIIDLKQKVVRTVIDFFLDPSILICFAGAIVCFIAIFGVIGSLREITCCIKTYYIVLMVMLVFQVGAIILVFVFYFVPTARTTLGLYPENVLKDAIVKYRDDADMQNVIDEMQVQLKCCGVSNEEEGYKDWSANIYFNCSDNSPGPKSSESCSVPWSCCKSSALNVVVNGKTVGSNYECAGKVMGTDSSTSNIHTMGCLKGLEVWLNNNALIIAGVALGILLPQAIFIYLAKSLYWQIKSQMDKW